MRDFQKVRIVVVNFFLVSLILICVSIHAKTEAASFVEFDATGFQFKNQKIYESKSLKTIVGLVGDIIHLENGTYTFFIDAPENHKAIIDLTVSNGEIRINSSEVKLSVSDGWVNEWETIWQASTTKTNEEGKINTIRLPDVNFIETLPESRYRSSSSIGCDRANFEISVSSTPPGAEIWIDGKKTRYVTSTGERLTGSFCINDPKIDLLLRKSGSANCQSSIDVVPGKFVEFDCELRTP